MATMLAYVFTDIPIELDDFKELHREYVITHSIQLLSMGKCPQMILLLGYVRFLKRAETSPNDI